MSRIIPLNQPVVPFEFTRVCGWCSHEHKFASRGKICTINNREYVVVIKRAKSNPSLAKMCAAIAVIVVTCGLALRSTQFIKWVKKTEKVRFAIPADNFTKLQQPPKNHKIAQKISDLLSFYRDYYINTKNEQAVEEIISNCISRSQTINDLSIIISECDSNDLLSNSAKDLMRKKFFEFGANSGKLSDVLDVIHKLAIQDLNTDNTIVERMLTERHGLKGYHSYRSLVIDRFSTEKNHLVENLGPLIPAIDLSDNNLSSSVTVKAVKIILANHVPCNAYDKASVYAITNASQFSSEDLVKAVKYIISQKVPCSQNVYKSAVSYLLLNKDSFTPEELFQAVAQYQSLNSPSVLIDLQIKTVYNLV